MAQEVAVKALILVARILDPGKPHGAEVAAQLFAAEIEQRPQVLAAPARRPARRFPQDQPRQHRVPAAATPVSSWSSAW